MDTWRQFEILVFRIEASLLPVGAEVKSPDRIRDKVTGQLREVDASIRYQVGTTPILITLECRERASVQDDTWIEQLASKKHKIGASVTVAVSSEGFSAPAQKSAEHNGIEIRTLTDVSHTDAAQWINDIEVTVEFREWRFLDLKLQLVNAPNDVELDPRFLQQIEDEGYEAALAFRREDSKPLIMREIGENFVKNGLYPPFPNIKPFGSTSPNDGTYTVPTTDGQYELGRVDMMVEILDVKRLVPVRRTLEYADVSGPIVRVAEYQYEVGGEKVSIGIVQRS